MSDDLKSALLELIASASERGLTVLLGGGYGLYLKQLHRMESKERTYLQPEAWPRPRGTPDLDVFLPTDLISSFSNATALREVLDRLGYEHDPRAAFMHFERKSERGAIRVEFLTGPLDEATKATLKIKGVRVRPKGELQLHAHLTNEALDVEQAPLVVSIDGRDVLIPNTFAFLLMKLHATRDRIDDEDKGLGRHHALDVYRLLAMMTEAEEAQVREAIARNAAAKPVLDAKEIVKSLFANKQTLGTVRMLEHPLAGTDLQVGRALALLNDLFAHDES